MDDAGAGIRQDPWRHAPVDNGGEVSSRSRTRAYLEWSEFQVDGDAFNRERKNLVCTKSCFITKAQQKHPADGSRGERDVHADRGGRTRLSVEMPPGDQGPEVATSGFSPPALTSPLRGRVEPLRQLPPPRPRQSWHYVLTFGSFRCGKMLHTLLLPRLTILALRSQDLAPTSCPTPRCCCCHCC